MRTITTLLTGLLLFSNVALFAQSKNNKTNLLYKFMQANADTTIVVELVTNWVSIAPDVYLLSKKGDTLTCYTYRDLVYQRYGGILIPTTVRRAMRKIHERRILTVPMDVNEFFSINVVSQQTLKSMWNEIISEQPWTLLDDEKEGEGCPIKSKNNQEIYDGGGVNLYLITKEEIKQLYFYAPGFYQKYCKRKGREAVLKIESLFYKNVH